jgi:hypothetical protein
VSGELGSIPTFGTLEKTRDRRRVQEEFLQTTPATRRFPGSQRAFGRFANVQESSAESQVESELLGVGAAAALDAVANPLKG